MGPKLSLTCALSWIVGSSLLISAIGHKALKVYFQPSQKTLITADRITSLVQTGPQKGILRSEYLAELMQLSKDRPALMKDFDPKKAEKYLSKSPLIQKVQVKTLKPSSVYVDYTVRQPVAWLYDYENVAIDREGYLFPIHPFFPPKNLPELYLGLASFGAVPTSPGLPQALWNTPLTGPYIELCFDLLSRLESLAGGLFTLRRIDVSKAFASSYGQREIVVIIENTVPSKQSPEAFEICTHYLRLSSKDYPQELGNYLELRSKLLESVTDTLSEKESSQAGTRIAEKIIDLRIGHLGFIEDVK